MSSNKTNLILTLTFAAFLAATSAANAAFVIEYGAEFSGGADPVGATPWLTATFEDVVANEVKLTFEATNLSATEFVTEVTFNLDPALNVADLTISLIAGSKVGTFNDPGIDTGTNAFSADGSHGYDIELSFASGPPSARFSAGESFMLKIVYSGAGTFNENSFDFNNEPGNKGGHSGLLTGAHVQGINGNDSGWVTGDGVGDDDDDDDDDETPVIPTPAAFPAGLALLGLAAIRRRRTA